MVTEETCDDRISMHIGIDDFATVNETHGSNYGDYVLNKCCRLYERVSVRKSATLSSGCILYVIVDLVDSTSMDDAIQLKRSVRK